MRQAPHLISHKLQHLPHVARKLSCFTLDIFINFPNFAIDEQEE